MNWSVHFQPDGGAPLKHLNVRGCKKLTGYTPVPTLPRLERLRCDVLPAALLPLRESATLQSIEADACPCEGSQGALRHGPSRVGRGRLLHLFRKLRAALDVELAAGEDGDLRDA